jgi:hypothetical protein
MTLLEHLADEVQKTGHAVRREGASLVVEPVNLKLDCEIGERNEHNVNGVFSVVYSVSIKATHERLLPGGIWDSLAGFGTSDDQAFSYAARVWTSGVFPPIHEILVTAETPGFGVPRLNLVSRNEETGEVFAWKLYLGDLQATGDFAERTETLEIDVLPKRMFDAIVSELYEKKLVWVKAYICKMPDGSLHGDCWLNNQDWVEGLNALYWFAEEWGETRAYTSMKQFMIIKPCEWDEVENAEELKRSLPPL